MSLARLLSRIPQRESRRFVARKQCDSVLFLVPVACLTRVQLLKFSQTVTTPTEAFGDNISPMLYRLCTKMSSDKGGKTTVTYWRTWQTSSVVMEATEKRSYYTDLMRWRTENDGHRHPDTLASMANLTSTYLNQGRWTEAEALGVQVLETSKTVLGTEHPAPRQHEQPFLYPDVSRKAPRS